MITGLSESEIETGKALSANIQALQNNLIALAMTEQLFVEQLRQARRLGAEFVIRHWETGFEVKEDGKQND